MNRLLLTVAAAMIAPASATQTDPGAAMAQDPIQMFRDRRDDAGASASHFVGSGTTVSRFALRDAPFSCGIVTFDAGGHTRWHSHPYGQLLIVTAGSGWIQTHGGPVRAFRAGDLIWTPPNIRHWHGATPGSAMSHASVTVRGPIEVTWQEAPEYRGPSRHPGRDARTSDKLVTATPAAPRAIAPATSGGVASFTPVPLGQSVMQAGIAAFAPGSRADWTRSATGRLLIVTSGRGWVQAENAPVRAVVQGDVIWIPPGINHWHGATRTTTATYASVNTGELALLKRPVDDRQFTGP